MYAFSMYKRPYGHFVATETDEEPMKAMNTEKEKWHLPHLGQRIVKTAMAVFVCQVIYFFMRGTWQEMGVGR